MSRGKYLVKNTAAFALGSLGSKLINFFLVPLYTNYLTTGQYGTTDLAFTLCSIAIPFMILNINEAIMRLALDEDADYNQIMTVGLVAIVMSLFSGIILWIAASLYTPVALYKNYIYIYAVTYGMCEIFLCFLRGKEKLLMYSLGNMLRTFLIAVFSVVLLVVFKFGSEGYFMAYIISNIVTTMFCFAVGDVADVFKHLNFNKELAKRMLNYSVWLIPTSLMWWIMNSSDRIMVTAMVSISASGIYAAASKVPALIATVSTIFNQAFSYSAIHERGSVDEIEFHNMIFEYLFTVVTFCGIGLLMVLKPFMKIYVSEAYFQAWEFVPPLIVGTCILVLGTFLSVFYTVNKDSKGFMKSGIIGAITNIILNFTLIPFLGALGAAIATCLSYIAVFVFRSIDIKKYIELKLYSKEHFYGLTLLVTSCFLEYFESNKIYFGFAVIIFIAMYIYKDNLKKMIKYISKSDGK